MSLSARAPRLFVTSTKTTVGKMKVVAFLYFGTSSMDKIFPALNSQQGLIEQNKRQAGNPARRQEKTEAVAANRRGTVGVVCLAGAHAGKMKEGMALAHAQPGAIARN